MCGNGWRLGWLAMFGGNAGLVSWKYCGWDSVGRYCSICTQVGGNHHSTAHTDTAGLALPPAASKQPARYIKCKNTWQLLNKAFIQRTKQNTKLVTPAKPEDHQNEHWLGYGERNTQKRQRNSLLSYSEGNIRGAAGVPVSWLCCMSSQDRPNEIPVQAHTKIPTSVLPDQLRSATCHLCGA